MHVRPFKLQDLPRAADVFIECVPRDTLGLFMRPDPMKYHTSRRKGCVSYIRSMVTAQGNQCFVTVADSNDSSEYIAEEKVVAWIIFQRLGKSPTATRWQNSNPASSPLERFSSWLQMRYLTTFPSTDPAAHVQNVARIQQLDEPWDPEIFAEAWVVKAVCVAPKWQRRGISGQLLDWGKEQAVRERVPIVVKGSALGGPAYRKHGFRSIGFNRFGQFFDELKFGGEGHQLWVWEPEGMEGDWYERAKIWWEEQVGQSVARGDFSKPRDR